MWVLFTKGWSNKKNLVALSYACSSSNYACCDDFFQPVVHKGHDMKLPLAYHAIFRMKEFYDHKAEMYHGAVLRGASAQGAKTKDIQHDCRRDFIKFPSRESGLPGDDHVVHRILDDSAKHKKALSSSESDPPPVGYKKKNFRQLGSGLERI